MQSQGTTAKGKGGDTGEDQAEGEESSRLLWCSYGEIERNEKVHYRDVYTMPWSK